MTQDPRCPKGMKPAFPEALDVMQALEEMKAQLVRSANKCTEIEMLLRSSHEDAYDGKLPKAVADALTKIHVTFAPAKSTVTLRLFESTSDADQ